MPSLFRLASLLALVCACSGKPQVVDLSQRLPPGAARAGVVAKASDLVGGPTATGKVGDFKLYNSRIQVIVERPGPSHGYDTYGGLIVDADVVRPEGQKGESLFGEAIALYNLRTPRGVTAEVVNDGQDGKAAVVRVHAVDDAFPLVEAVLGQNKGPLGLAVDLDYVLEPDAPFVRCLTTLKNTGTEVLHTDNFVGYVMGDGLRPFLSGHGFDLPQLPHAAPFFAAVGDRVSYSFLSLDGQFQPLLTFQGFLMGALDKLTLEPGATRTLETVLVVGDGDLAAHERVQRALLAQAGLQQPATTLLTGRVTDRSGHPVAGARVHVRLEKDRAGDDYVVQTVSRAEGVYAVDVEPGTYRVQATADGRDPGPERTVLVGQETTRLEVAVSDLGRLELQVTEEGQPVPAKVLAKRAGVPPAAPASFGLLPRYHGYERTEFLPPGTQTLELPPGHYSVLVARGFEYEVATLELDVPAGETVTQQVELVHSVDTAGWVSGDYHVHAQYSPDSDDPVEHKVLAFGAEGVEVPVSTEHEHIADFAPVVERLGLSRWVRTIVGEEISTLPLGHFNAFPMAQDLGAANFGAILWYGVKGDDLMKLIRTNPARPLLQVNHPRSGSFGSPVVKGYFSAVGFDPATFTVKADHDWSTDYDALEISNGEPPHFDDWFAFLDRGRRLLATGDSDSHTARSDWVGYPRNYVQTGVDVAGDVQLAPYMEALRAGKLTVSGGFFVQAQVADHPLGSFVPAGEVVGGKLPVQVRVQAPGWMPAGKMVILVNGQPVLEKGFAQPLTRTAERLAETFQVPVSPEGDSHIVVSVEGTGDLSPVYPGARAFGFTNPLFVDGNGNGQLDARLR